MRPIRTIAPLTLALSPLPWRAARADSISQPRPSRPRSSGPLPPPPRRPARQLGFERDLEPRLAADRGDLAHLAGWAAKLAGATCRVAGLLHLASHLRDGWAQPIGTDTFAAAIRLADYLIDHAWTVFDLMCADPRVDDARWLLDWIARTGRTQFSRRDAHQAARGRFRKATDLEPVLALLEEHGHLRRVDADPAGSKGGRPPSPRFLVNPLSHNSEPSQPSEPVGGPVLRVVRVLRCVVITRAAADVPRKYAQYVTTLSVIAVRSSDLLTIC